MEAPMSPDSTPTTLYRLADAQGVLLYVGIAGNPGRRFEQHKKDKLWWGDVAAITLEHFQTREEAAAAELAAIRSEHPRYNIVGRVTEKDIDRVLRLEPLAGDILAISRAIQAGDLGPGCMCEWFYASKPGMRALVVKTVGWSVKRHLPFTHPDMHPSDRDFLASPAAYDALYHAVYDLMPYCTDYCGHVNRGHTVNKCLDWFDNRHPQRPFPWVRGREYPTPPTFTATAEPDGTWTVACDVCRCWHHHNPDNPEPARCVGGPYGTTGYWMQYGGRRVRVRSWRSLNPGRLRIWHGEDIFNPPGTSPFDPEVAAA
jgi:predicted GIY-YIG superfamily endonuclease